MYFHLLCNFATSLIFTFPAGPAMRTRLAVPRHVATAIISLLCQRIAFVECFSTSLPRVRYESVALGAGCFWHVEFALRRLPGVLATETAYAGGSTLSPSYRDVCEGRTGHAEVVKISFDPDVMQYDVLFDCFLSMHDPTKVRSHGKHAEGTGQYRSSIFCENPEIYQAALVSLGRCREQLGKELSTDLRLMQTPTPDSPFGEGWGWKAEERHQRHGPMQSGGHQPRVRQARPRVPHSPKCARCIGEPMDHHRPLEFLPSRVLANGFWFKDTSVT